MLGVFLMKRGGFLSMLWLMVLMLSMVSIRRVMFADSNDAGVDNAAATDYDMG